MFLAKLVQDRVAAYSTAKKSKLMNGVDKEPALR